MKWMGWDYQALQDAPAELVERVIEHINKTAEQTK